jgi:hypothetical protein
MGEKAWSGDVIGTHGTGRGSLGRKVGKSGGQDVWAATARGTPAWFRCAPRYPDLLTS